MDTTILSEFGLIGWWYILMLWSILYYVPKLFKEHFSSLDRMQDKFWVNLEKITDKNTAIAEWFIWQLHSITKEHEHQNKLLEDIHSDVKHIKERKCTD